MHFEEMNTQITTSDFSLVLCMPLFMHITIVKYRKKIPSLCSSVPPIPIPVIPRLAHSEHFINEMSVSLSRDESSAEFGSLSPLFS